MTESDYAAATQAIDADDVETLRRLVAERPHVVHVRDEHSATLLAYIVECTPEETPNLVEAIGVVLDGGADIEARRNDEGGTALASAMRMRRPEMAEALIARGADIRSPLGYDDGTILERLDRDCEDMQRIREAPLRKLRRVFADAAGRTIPRRPSMGICVPFVCVKDFDAGLDYYTQTLGFSIEWHDGRFAELRRGGAAFVLQTCECDDRRHTGTTFVSIEVDGIDDLYTELVGAGAIVQREIQDTDWGEREFVVADADGNWIRFRSNIA